MLSRKTIAYDRTPNDRHPVFANRRVLHDASAITPQTARELAQFAVKRVYQRRVNTAY